MEADTKTKADIRLRVLRQDGPDQKPRWETFAIPYQPNMNVISLLIEVQRNPVTADGTATAPVVWDCNCLEEVCGACSMVVNGRVRQACTGLVDNLLKEGATIVLEPLTKFPVVRDLFVDRQSMFEGLKKVGAWIALDGTHDLGPGPRQTNAEQQVRYPLSECMTCGCCMEACPQVSNKSAFVGPFAVSQVRFFNTHPNGADAADQRLDALMEDGGIQDCGNAQACVDACPKEIPLSESIAWAGRETTKRWFRRILG